MELFYKILLVLINFKVIFCVENILIIYPKVDITHQQIGEQMAVQLILKYGYGVTFLSPLNRIEHVKEKNYSSYPLSMNYEDEFITTALLQKKNIDYISKLQIGDMLSDDVEIGIRISNFILRHVKELFWNNLNKNQSKYDLIILDFDYCNAAIGLGQHYNASVVLLGIDGHNTVLNDFMGVEQPSSYIPHPYLNNNRNSKMDIWDRLNNMISYNYERFYLYWYHYPAQKQIYNEYFPETKTSFYNATKHVVAIFIYSDVQFSYPRPLLRETMINVGDWNVKDMQRSTLAETVDSFIDSATTSVIFISFNQFSLPVEKKNQLLNIFARSKFHFVWRCEYFQMKNESKNVFIAPWLEESVLLKNPKVKIFITTGDMQSINYALINKKPIIGIVGLSKQNMRINKAVEQGWAIQIKLSDISKKLLYSIINGLLLDGRYKVAVTKYSKWAEIYNDVDKHVFHKIHRVLRDTKENYKIPEPSRYTFHENEYNFFSVLLLVGFIVFVISLVIACCWVYCEWKRYHRGSSGTTWDSKPISYGDDSILNIETDSEFNRDTSSQPALELQNMGRNILPDDSLQEIVEINDSLELPSPPPPTETYSYYSDLAIMEHKQVPIPKPAEFLQPTVSELISDSVTISVENNDVPNANISLLESTSRKTKSLINKAKQLLKPMKKQPIVPEVVTDEQEPQIEMGFEYVRIKLPLKDSYSHQENIIPAVEIPTEEVENILEEIEQFHAPIIETQIATPLEGEPANLEDSRLPESQNQAVLKSYQQQNFENEIENPQKESLEASGELSSLDNPETLESLLMKLSIENKDNENLDLNPDQSEVVDKAESSNQKFIKIDDVKKPEPNIVKIKPTIDETMDEVVIDEEAAQMPEEETCVFDVLADQLSMRIVLNEVEIEQSKNNDKHEKQLTETKSKCSQSGIYLKESDDSVEQIQNLELKQLVDKEDNSVQEEKKNDSKEDDADIDDDGATSDNIDAILDDEVVGIAGGIYVTNDDNYGNDAGGSGASGSGTGVSGGVADGSGASVSGSAGNRLARSYGVDGGGTGDSGASGDVAEGGGVDDYYLHPPPRGNNRDSGTSGEESTSEQTEMTNLERGLEEPSSNSTSGICSGNEPVQIVGDPEIAGAILQANLDHRVINRVSSDDEVD